MPFCGQCTGGPGKPLVCFVGGFMDRTYGHCVETCLYQKYLSDPVYAPYASRQTVVYKTHDQKDEIVELIENNYASYNQHVCLVGHSWGGSCAERAAAATRKVVDLLITLDPVGFIHRAPSRRVPTLRQWINVFVDSSGGPALDDVVGAIGGQWGSVAVADANRPFHGHHADVPDMFQSLWGQICSFGMYS